MKKIYILGMDIPMVNLVSHNWYIDDGSHLGHRYIWLKQACSSQKLRGGFWGSWRSFLISGPRFLLLSNEEFAVVNGIFRLCSSEIWSPAEEEEKQGNRTGGNLPSYTGQEKAESFLFLLLIIIFCVWLFHMTCSTLVSPTRDWTQAP